MNLIVAAALAAIAGLSWNWSTDNQPMSYWMTFGFLFGSCAVVDVLEWLWERRRARRQRARRSAVTRRWNATQSADAPDRKADAR